MSKIDVTPIEIRDYAISIGWQLVKEATKDGLFVLNSPTESYRQLIFPIEPTSYNYDSMAELAIKKISEITNTPTFQIVEDIRGVYDDSILLRYHSEVKNVNSLSFQEAVDTIEATKQLILTAGSSVVNPVLYHKRLSRSEATELLKRTRFRHTKEGSFIIKVSCPVELETAPKVNLFNEEIGKPISRKAFELINLAAFTILKTIEENTLDELFESQKNSETPIISYNLCDSLAELFDDERELPIELNFNWSKAYSNKLPPPKTIPSVKFPYSFKPKIVELKNYFAPESKEAVDTFWGSVESLNGDEGENGRRSGEVILALLIESEIVKARLNLNADQYEIAYKAHGIIGGLVKVKGKLQPGQRIRTMENIELFDLVEK